jgi:hypothetical protein
MMETQIKLCKTRGVVANPCKRCRLLTNPLDDHDPVPRIKDETRRHGRQQPIHHDAVTAATAHCRFPPAVFHNETFVSF